MKRRKNTVKKLKRPEKIFPIFGVIGGVVCAMISIPVASIIFRILVVIGGIYVGLIIDFIVDLIFAMILEKFERKKDTEDDSF